MNKGLLLATFALVMLGTLGCTRRHGKECNEHQISDWGESYLYNKLDLTADQKSEFKDLISEFNLSQKRIADERSRIHREFAGLFEGETFDKTKAQSLINESRALIENESKIIIPKLEVAHGRLDKEQKKKLANLIREHSKKE